MREEVDGFDPYGAPVSDALHPCIEPLIIGDVKAVADEAYHCRAGREVGMQNVATARDVGHKEYDVAGATGGGEVLEGLGYLGYLKPAFVADFNGQRDVVREAIEEMQERGELVGAEVGWELHEAVTEQGVQLGNLVAKVVYERLGCAEVAGVAYRLGDFGAKTEVGGDSVLPFPDGLCVGNAVMCGVQLNGIELLGVVPEVIGGFRAFGVHFTDPFFHAPARAAYINRGCGRVTLGLLGEPACIGGVIRWERKIYVFDAGQFSELHDWAIWDGKISSKDTKGGA